MAIGIYKIENKITHQVYIGQSIDIKSRWIAHKCPGTWNNSNKPSYYYRLYTAFREYGLNNFDFSIIEECKKEELDEKEKYWIKYYNSYLNGYNMTIGGSGAYNNDSAPVYKYSLEGNFLQEYSCVRKAAEENNLTPRNIYLALSRNSTAGNYQWSYTKVNKIDSNFIHNIPVICFTLDGHRINTYTGMSEAIKRTGDTWLAIKKSCETHQHSGKYQWRYWIENPDVQEIPPYQWTSTQAVDQYDLNGIYIKTYNSLSEASGALGLTTPGLTTCCRNRQKSCGGFLWCYHNDPPPEPYIDKRARHTTSSNKRAIVQYSKENEYLNEYESAHAAARAIDKPKCANHITECCQGKRKTCEGFIWKYKE